MAMINEPAQTGNGYNPDGAERDLNNLVTRRVKEAKDNFTGYERDRLDLFYKNFRSYTGDRLEKLKKAGGADWMSNMFVPMTASHIRALLPRIISAKPDMRVDGRSEKDQRKSKYAQALLEYLWEKAGMDSKMRDFVFQALIYGTSVGKMLWKRERQVKTDTVVNEETLEITDIEDIEDMYNDPDFQVVDLYNFYPDPLATSLDDARYVIQRFLMTKQQILETYGELDEGNVKLIGNGSGGDTQDYGSVRYLVSAQDNLDGTTTQNPHTAMGVARPEVQKDVHEVIEYWEKNRFVLQVDGIILREGKNPFGISEYPFVLARYETLPFEFYGIGVGEQLEQPQKTLNIIRNQRIDNVTLTIQQMFIANPFALISQKDLVARPFGIIRTTDPNGVTPVNVPEVKQSAYQEDTLTQEAGLLATGIDDRSRGIAGAASATATDVTIQKESTLERVSIFVKTLETDCYEKVTRYWLAMAAKLYPTEVLDRIIEDGTEETVNEGINRPLKINLAGGQIRSFASKQDLFGNFDIKVLALSTLVASKELKIRRLLDLMDKAVVAGADPVSREMVPNMRELWRQLFMAYDMDPDQMMNPAGTNQLPSQKEGGTVEAGTTAVPSKNELLNNLQQSIVGIGKLGTQGAPSERTTPLPAQGAEFMAALQP